ncbi:MULTISPECIES: hypothetical protein [unclassified Paenibacillus]|uniref:hypothetical protein n=1 Tax=unclassified Paenibacillus TaxID=185978 RepID=UPI0008D1FDCA|nr:MULTISPECIES: hypothetical protein [unclassified Paenibacillus]QLG42365.1 hypothetical protein HW560_32460 [Paenibacillus sp. E222]SEM82356.1 hypothetical protein SAMN05518670_0321 [Paenibacillus sp. OK076]
MRREWFDPFRSDVEVVFAAAEQLVQKYPEPMSEHALEQLHLVNPLLRDSGHSYIGYIIPLWMQLSDGLPPEKAHKLSTACLLHMLYFLNQDEVMDEQPEDVTLKLSLGNLYYVDAICAYSELFSLSSPFWTYFRQYVEDWAMSVNGENTIDYFKRSPLFIAQKAAPLQLGAAGSLLLLEQEHRITPVCSAVNIALMTLQMTDDFTDTKQDAVHGNYNSFLSHISAALEHNYPVHPVSERIHDNVYNTQLMNSYVDIAQQYNIRLTSSNSGITHLEAFNSYLCGILGQTVQDIEQHKKMLFQGGFHYWISEKQHLS